MMHSFEQLVSLEEALGYAKRKSNQHAPLSPDWRRIIVEWCYSIVDRVGADREVVSITMNILDRYFALKTSVSNCYAIDSNSYETAVLSSLLISTKLYSKDQICMKQLVQMSSKCITNISAIMSTAKDIYRSLSWDQTIPTPAKFIRALLQLLPENTSEKSKTDLFEVAIYQIELSVQDALCSRHPPSLIAWMAIENALQDTSCLSSEDTSAFRRSLYEAAVHDYNQVLRSRLQNLEVNEVSVLDGENENQDQDASIKPLELKSIPHVISVLELDSSKHTYSEDRLLAKRKTENISLHRSKRTKCLHAMDVNVNV